jgi:hypothetical protein
VFYDTASALLGVAGLRVTDVEAGSGGVAQVWAVATLASCSAHCSIRASLSPAERAMSCSRSPALVSIGRFGAQKFSPSLDRTLRLLLGKRGVASEEADAYLTRLLGQMNTTFPDALVPEWEPLVEAIQLPDPQSWQSTTSLPISRHTARPDSASSCWSCWSDRVRGLLSVPPSDSAQTMLASAGTSWVGF